MDDFSQRHKNSLASKTLRWRRPSISILLGTGVFPNQGATPLMETIVLMIQEENSNAFTSLLKRRKRKKKLRMIRSFDFDLRALYREISASDNIVAAAVALWAFLVPNVLESLHFQFVQLERAVVTDLSIKSACPSAETERFVSSRRSLIFGIA